MCTIPPVSIPSWYRIVGTNTSVGGPISMLSIRMGVQLMLAQAQLCFYEKVTTVPSLPLSPDYCTLLPSPELSYCYIFPLPLLFHPHRLCHPVYLFHVPLPL